MVLSDADMEFKFPLPVFRKLQESLENPHFGYPNIKQSQLRALSDWVHNRYENSAAIHAKTTVFWNNTVTILHGVIDCLT